MQDNDFDKIFSHKFGQLPGEPYSEKIWSELSRRIDTHERRQRRWLLPPLLPLFGLLAGGNLFWWYQWREANGELKDSKSRTTIFQPDTIMRKTVVYHYDTIYQNVTLVQRQNAAMPAQFSSSTPFNSFSANNFSSNNTTNTNTNPFSPNPAFIGSPAAPTGQDSVKQQLANGDAAASAHTIVHKIPVDTSEQASPPLPAEAAATDTLFDQLLNPPPIPTKKNNHLSSILHGRGWVSARLGGCPAFRTKFPAPFGEQALVPTRKLPETFASVAKLPTNKPV